MMIHEITSQVGRRKQRQRKGRGESSGRGKTSGRGNKGSKARVGTTYKPTYEGGQTELFRRFPIRGFSNHNFARRFHIVNLADIEAQFADGAVVDQVALVDAGLIPDDKLPVKVLGQGSLTKKLTITAGKYSKSAHEKLIGAGGVAQNAKGETFAFAKPKKKFVKREEVKKSSKKQAEEPAAEAPKAAE